MNQAPVYLDYNATTPLATEVRDAISQSLEMWGNPSSGKHMHGVDVDFIS